MSSSCVKLIKDFLLSAGFGHLKLGSAMQLISILRKSSLQLTKAC